MNVGSLFAGIGGFDLGFERAGMRTLWFCEQDPYCQRVLAKHWPGVPCYPDVRSLVADTQGTGQLRAVQLENDKEGQRGGRRPDAGASGQVPPQDGRVPVSVPPVDILCGGFPCQDISLAGKGAGIDGERSGLWAEYARIIGELRPRYVVVENVPALLSRGLGRVLGDLAALGYDAEWDCLPASAFGAPHRRDRIWLVAYPSGDELRVQPRGGSGESGARPALVGVNGETRYVADSDREGPQGRGLPRSQRSEVTGAGDGHPPHPDTDRRGFKVNPELDGETEQNPSDWDSRGRHADGLRDEVADATSLGQERPGETWDGGPRPPNGCIGENPWATEPNVGRVANGIPNRVDRLSALGNALVPQIAEWLGRRILEYEHESEAA